MDRNLLITQLQNEFRKSDDLIPLVEESKYISSTNSLNCDVLDIQLKDLKNLVYYIEQLKNNLREAGREDYSKLQSSYYAEMAEKCVNHIIREKIKKE